MCGRQWCQLTAPATCILGMSNLAAVGPWGRQDFSNAILGLIQVVHQGWGEDGAYWMGNTLLESTCVYMDNEQDELLVKARGGCFCWVGLCYFGWGSHFWSKGMTSVVRQVRKHPIEGSVCRALGDEYRESQSGSRRGCCVIHILMKKPLYVHELEGPLPKERTSSSGKQWEIQGCQRRGVPGAHCCCRVKVKSELNDPAG